MPKRCCGKPDGKVYMCTFGLENVGSHTPHQIKIVRLMARILIISTKQPSSNPRMRKSADALASAGHKVHVLYAYTTTWADESDKFIFQSKKWTSTRIGGHPRKQPFVYHKSRLLRRLYELAGSITKAQCRGFSDYIRQGIHWNPDLIIGHNPGTLGPLLALREKLNVPVLFDAEDFHRGETSSGSTSSRAARSIEDKVLTCLETITAASPLIAERYQKTYSNLDVYTVNNAFPIANQQAYPTLPEGPLSIAWFSQVTGLDRGLEEFILAMNGVKDLDINLNILGSRTREIEEKILALDSYSGRIKFHDPVPQHILFEFLQSCELGLALELKTPENRDLCRTNKLYTYPLAGCYTLLSKTTAQEDFVREFPDAGEIIDLEDPKSIANTIRRHHANRHELVKKRIKAWELAKSTLNWEMESQSLLHVVNSKLQQ